MARAVATVTAGLAATAILFACGGEGGGSGQGGKGGAAGKPVTGVTIPVTGHVIGFSTPGFPDDLAANQAAAADAGARETIASWYTPLGQSFNAAKTADISQHGLLPLIEIDSDTTPVRDIADGDWDAYFKDYARQVASYHARIAIDFDHEFNGAWSPWGYPHTTAPEFVSAWRRIVTIFRDNGAGNVYWIWNPNVLGGTTVNLTPWYPGDQYVSWVGLDGYFFSRTDTFDSVFSATLAKVHSFTSKPVFIVETGAEPGSSRPEQIRSLFAGLAADPRILGFIWFDYDKAPGHQWRLEGDQPALAAFRQAAAAYQKR